MLKIPDFQNKKELFEFLIENKTTLLAQKMNTVKYADGFVAHNTTTNKSFVPKLDPNATEIKIKAVINTTNIMDSHKDVHLQGIWTKSLKENKRIMHIQEHQSQSFDKIIADGNDLKAYAEMLTWKSLGYEAEGSTQALVFDSVVKQSRNPYMFDQYVKGYVNNHSVGMRYVKIVMAINDKDYPEELQAWEKYYPEIINKEEADATGYFWAVTEAKAIEGSAVPIGSNPITPTLEPSSDTQKEAALGTFKLSEAINKLNIKI